MGKVLRFAAAGLWAVAMACGAGDDAGITGPGEGAESGSSEATPFAVDAVPPGFRLEVAGRGTGIQEWGEDSTGTDEPFTVLAPPGAGAASEQAVVVSVTGYEGYQGGLGQASGGYGDGDVETFEVDGRPAIYAPASSDGFPGPLSWADLVVVRGDDLAVRVTAADARREELVDIAQRAVPEDDHARAPQVPDPPDGLEVVGSVDAGVTISLSPYVQPDSDHVPGLESAFAAGWLAGPAPAAGTGLDPDVTVVAPGGTPAGPAEAVPSVEPPAEPTSLTLVSYPGRTADLVALGGMLRIGHHQNATLTPLTVAGRPAVLVETDQPEYDYLSRTLLTHAAWGDLLMAGSGGPRATVPTVDRLTALLASARPTSADEWDAFVVAATGGPGLNPDPGAGELERGTVAGADGDVDWLLQARPGALDACLKLSTRQRACAVGGGSSEGTSLGTGGGEPDRDGGIPEFLLATVDVPGARLRVTTPTAIAEGALHPVPGADLWGGVVFVDGLERTAPVCPGYPEVPEHMTPVAVEVVDESGAVVGCVGVSGDVIKP